ncbi:MAG TPA: YfiR family protein [Burkholderiales bacterium]|jgi:hypothetical protein
MAKLILRLALLAVALLGASGAGQAQVERASEVQVKAAYLYQFGGFVEWPPQAFAGPDGAFAIGLIGAEAMAAELEQIVATRQVQGRQVVVRRLRPGEPLGGLQVLFVGGAEDERLPEILSAARGAPLLVVTESEGALARGSMINFVAVDNRVRFDVALPQAERSRLRISSRLLGVARRVVQG